MEFWQTKSFICNHDLRYDTSSVTSQNGERVLFERLETPRPTPKVTLRKDWKSQQQHSTSGTDVRSPWKREARREDQAGVQNVSNHSTEVDLATRKLGHTASNMEVDIRFYNKGVSTNAVLESEAVKEETAEANTKANERIKIGSNKILYS